MLSIAVFLCHIYMNTCTHIHRYTYVCVYILKDKWFFNDDFKKTKTNYIHVPEIVHIHRWVWSTIFKTTRCTLFVTCDETSSNVDHTLHVYIWLAWLHVLGGKTPKTTKTTTEMRLQYHHENCCGCCCCCFCPKIYISLVTQIQK